MNRRTKHPGGARKHRRNSNSFRLDFAQLEPRQLLASIDIIAAGVEGQEQVSLQIDQQTVATWTNLGGDAYQNDFVTLSFSNNETVTAGQVRVLFQNDLYDPANGIDRSVRIDAIVIDGERFETEAPVVFSTGTWKPEDGVAPGFRASEYLHSNGYFQYSTANPGTGSSIIVRASGDEGLEQFELQIDGQTVASFAATTSFQSYAYQSAQMVTADQLQIAFTNDFYDPQLGIDYNLNVDYVSLDGVVFQTEAPDVFSTATFKEIDGVTPGFRESETLHFNGYFAYAQSPDPGVISMATSVVDVAESDGVAKFTIIRTGGADGVVTVDYRTVELTADSGADFDSSSGTVVFLDGETSKTISVLLADDNEIETDEQFSFTIDNVIGADLLVPRTAIATIDDNDSVQSTGNGLLGEYFDGLGFSDPFQNRVDVWVHFDWSSGPPISGMGEDDFSVRWTGQIEPRYTETYTFKTLSDDGIRLWVDNDLIIDQWNDHSVTLHAGQISLNSGQRYDIRVEYYQRKLDAVAKLFWSSASQSLEVVPQTQLYAASSPDPVVDDELQSQILVTGLEQPTAIDFSPDGSLIYVAEKSGIVKVVQNGNLLPTPFLDFSGRVNNIRDRGLLDIAVHPDFENNPYVYLLYTYDPPEVNQFGGLAGPDGMGNRAGRLTRVTADANNNYLTVVPNSEVVLIGGNSTWDNFNGFVNSTNNFSEPPAGILSDGSNLPDFIASDSESHTVGSIDFAPDGALIVSTGDGASYNQVDPRAVRVQDIDNLSGKILRVDPITGNGLPDNPFFVEGEADANRSKVYQYGLRNPFRVHVNPDGGQVYVGDVGWSAWEEVNSAAAGANFGWPYYEGGNGVSVRTAGYQNLPEAQAFYASGEQATPSIFALSHAVDGVNAILLGDFYTGSAYPAEYQGDLFFNDLGQGIVRNMSFDESGNITSVETFTTGAFVVIDIVQSPDGNLYFVDLDDGTVGYWRFTESGRAFATASESAGAPVTSGLTTIGDASGITIAVIDSGSDLNHSQLAGAFWINPGEISDDGVDNDLNGYVDDVHGFDFADQDSLPLDSNGHGTFVAGAIGGLDGGLASGADLMTLRVLDVNGYGRWDAIAEAIRYAVDNKAEIVNLAVKTDRHSQVIEDQIRYASEQNVLVVVSAANETANSSNWLTELSERFENVVVAGAIGVDGRRIPANSGVVQVDAPETAFGPLLGGGWTIYRGDSIATASVTSAAAVALGINPELTAAQLRDLLVSSSSTAAGLDFAPSLDVTNVLAIANQSAEFEFNVVDDRLLIRTSRFDDEVRFDLGQSEILINGISYAIEPGYSQVSVHGKAGYDTISFGDTLQIDEAFAVTNFAQFASPTQTAIGMDFEKVQFRAANGDDSIWTRGSNGADLVTMEGAAFSLAGLDYFRGGTGFDSVRVVGGDGVDEANLTGTSVDETFFSAPNLVRLTHDNLFTQFVGLEVVVADLDEGSDSSIMLGGVVGDSLVLAPNSAQLIGAGFDYQVLSAEITTSYGGDGLDSSTIQDSSGNEVLNLRPRKSFILGEGFQHWAYGFETTEAESIGGNDRATVYGTDGNDIFTGGPVTSRYQGEGFDARLTGFPTILLFGNGGDDQSQIVAGSGSTNFYFSTQLAQITGPGMVHTMIGFNQFTFDGGNGDASSRLIANTGEDRLTVANLETVLDNDDYQIRLTRIDELFAVAATDTSDDTIEYLDNPNELEFEFDYVGDWFVI